MQVEKHKIIEQILDILDENFVSIKKEPEMILALYSDSPTAVVKDIKENRYKLVLISEILNLFKEKSKNKKSIHKLEFFEEGTRYYSNNLRIVEKPERKFNVTFLLEDNKTLFKKKITVPRRLWIIKKDKTLKIRIFAMDKWKEEKTLLYKMPFTNIMSDNSICWGNINKNNIYKLNVNINLLDKFFFEDTVFTKDNSRTVYVDEKGTYEPLKLWKRFSKIPAYSNLIKEGTLKEIVNDI